VTSTRALEPAPTLTTRRAVWLSAVWLAVGLVAGVPLMLADSGRGVEYWAVYTLERSLSLDNVFVFLLVLDYFMIPRDYRLRVVRWGIIAALALRAVAIAAGSALFDAFSVVSYVLGALLLVLSLRMLRGRDDEMDPASSPILRFVRRAVPLTPDASSGRFVVGSTRGWVITPLGLALVALAVADLTFAVDSVSAAFGITTDFLVIWVANAFALAGLVPLLALVRALARHFRYVSQTFAAILAFIALRLLTEDVVELGPLASLVGIAVILGVGLLASWIADRLAPPPESERAERRPPRCPPAVRKGV
jgi:tellurite resistance protein TerC